MTARTLEGLEWILARELEQVGAQDLRIGRRTIEFSAAPGAETETLYRAVLESRTAIRVLEPLGRFRVDSPDSLYHAMQEVDWTEQLKTSDTLRVDAAIHDTFLTHSLYAAQIVKDAIVDQLRTPSGKRPSVQLRGATLRLGWVRSMRRSPKCWPPASSASRAGGTSAGVGLMMRNAGVRLMMRNAGYC